MQAICRFRWWGLLRFKCQYHRASSSIASSSSRDTIFACSTGSGKYGVQIHRISGPGASCIAHEMLQRGRKVLLYPGRLLPTAIVGSSSQFGQPAAQPASKLAYYAANESMACETSKKELIDRGMGVFFAGPRSYTGEDVLEIHSHGSLAVRDAVEEAILQCQPHVQSQTDGVVRYARPGEFSRRALSNGKLDLTRVEGLGSLLEADTVEQRRSAMHVMEGALERQGRAWLEATTRAIAMTEAILDFGDEEADVGEQGAEGQLGAIVKRLVLELGGSLRASSLLRNRASMHSSHSVVLAGPPNAGKSSLFNALLQRDASIVTSEAGTTRDAVEAHVELGGAGARLLDTAGMRGTLVDRTTEQSERYSPGDSSPSEQGQDHDEGAEPIGPVEAEGIRRAYQAAAAADMVVVVADYRDVSGWSKGLDGCSEWIRSMDACARARARASGGSIGGVGAGACGAGGGGGGGGSRGVVLVLSKTDLVEANVRDGSVPELLATMRRQWDLAVAAACGPGADAPIPSELQVLGAVATSAQQEGGVTGLAELLASASANANSPTAAAAAGHSAETDGRLLLRERHRESVRLALHHATVAAALLGLENAAGEDRLRLGLEDPVERALALGGAEGDLVAVAEELRACAGRLGALLGHIDAEDVLDVVFKEFCMGK